MANTGIRIAKDSYVDYSSQSSREKIPTVSVSGGSVSLPVKGSLAYDTITDSIWYANGSNWAPVGSGSAVQITVIESTGMPPGTFGIIATPNPITGVGTIALADTSVTPGDYTSANIRVDQQGRLTFAENGSGGGTITEITAIASTGGTFGIECTPNPITGVGSIALADILTVAPGDYTNANITVDQQGRITVASSGTGGGTITEITAVASTGMPPGTFGIELTPNPITGIGTIALADIPSVTPGDYTNANIRVDQQGRITLASNGSGGGGGSGVTNITAIPSTGMPPGTFGIELTPNPITTLGTIALADILTVTPGNYTTPNITVDQQGRITFAENGEGYPLAPTVSFSGTVNSNGTSTFPGVTVVPTSTGPTPVGYFLVTGNFTKQQVAPKLFQVRLRFNIRAQGAPLVPGGSITVGGHFRFIINADVAGLNFPPNTTFTNENTYVTWSLYFRGATAPSPFLRLVSKIEYNWNSSTQIQGETGWIDPNGAARIETDTIPFLYYTDV